MHARLGCLLLLVLLVCCWVSELQARAAEPVTIYDAVSLGDDVVLLSVKHRADIVDQIEAPNAHVTHVTPDALVQALADLRPANSHQTLPRFRTSADPCYVFMILQQ